jgi:hypothetical protein
LSCPHLRVLAQTSIGYYRRSIYGMISDGPVVTVQSQEFAVLVQKVATEVKPIPTFSKVQDA